MPAAELREWREVFRRAVAEAMAASGSPPSLGAGGRFVKLVSEAWTILERQEALTRGFRQSVLSGLVSFIAGTLIITKSLRLTLIGAFTFVCNAVAIISMFYALGWGLGQTELVSIGVVLGSACGQVIHFVESYRETLHRAQSHLLGTKKTAKQGVQATLQRHGITYVTAYFTVIASAAIFYACTISLLQRIATIIIFSTVINGVHVLVFLPALLAVFAPSQISMRRSRRLGFLALGIFVLVVGIVLVAVS
jgi:predicted RND superfamily exporter protein